MGIREILRNTGYMVDGKGPLQHSEWNA